MYTFTDVQSCSRKKLKNRYLITHEDSTKSLNSGSMRLIWFNKSCTGMSKEDRQHVKNLLMMLRFTFPRLFQELQRHTSGN